MRESVGRRRRLRRQAADLHRAAGSRRAAAGSPRRVHAGVGTRGDRGMGYPVVLKPARLVGPAAGEGQRPRGRRSGAEHKRRSALSTTRSSTSRSTSTRPGRDIRASSSGTSASPRLSLLAALDHEYRARRLVRTARSRRRSRSRAARGARAVGGGVVRRYRRTSAAYRQRDQLHDEFRDRWADRHQHPRADRGLRPRAPARRRWR